ncbi:Sialidase_non-viral domain containing protein [uncultured Caudovirales phage]|uniref:Sialidase_non-viral domain containing protein n=1 Tax=uncultured Caudovirales phage TaxID=2100421 RepID=A0A6J7XCF5_9CAUD|nr:Sialidase_non-viral domain containing protein [uncultured Caudovirales phage]CAB4177176.1 Sialidase_non-viral domain containing protein [uncultured Caudovirales phage]CAB4181363.1 Sialidase_non-viral domain containing protein [uncultured Caudovirales phage]CAB4190887.1 Sialidase_non-viral domain containing protein [uncultured Caudovirales phage]CAB4211238.1 Sialidase_non-viral domain containing protein [uncultured Caudovirales phage]
MPITINGLTGISGADGSAATPFITGSDTDTGLYFPSAGNAAISINGTRALLVDNSNNVTMTGNVTATEFRFANGTSVLSAAAGNPTGTVLNYASMTAPTGYLACDGSIYSRSSYGALANVIGAPPMLTNFTAEFANTSWGSQYMLAANGVMFTSAIHTSAYGTNSFAGGLYTSTDGVTWTPRTARPILSTGFPNLAVNSAGIANVSGGYWVIANTGTGATGAPPTFGPITDAGTGTFFQSSTDLITWTNKSITFAATQTGVGNAPAPGGLYTNINGIAGGGTSNRLVALFTRHSLDSGYLLYNGYVANTATSDDGGSTWSFTNNIPVSNTSCSTSTIASSNGGFLVVRSNTAYWSYSGQTWQDITANLTTALGLTSTTVSPSSTRIFYAGYQANNQFIIPAINNKFLVSTPSGNGANGNWSVVGPVEGIPQLYFYASGTATPQSPAQDQLSGHGTFAASGGTNRIVHNGQCFVMGISGQIVFSQDLKYWFRKSDSNYALYGQAGGTNLVSLGNKFFLNMGPQNYTIVSFTANGSYTAATQFPAPKYSSIGSIGHSLDAPAVPLVPYIKT